MGRQETFSTCQNMLALGIKINAAIGDEKVGLMFLVAPPPQQMRATRLSHPALWWRSANLAHIWHGGGAVEISSKQGLPPFTSERPTDFSELA